MHNWRARKHKNGKCLRFTCGQLEFLSGISFQLKIRPQVHENEHVLRMETSNQKVTLFLLYRVLLIR